MKSTKRSIYGLAVPILNALTYKVFSTAIASVPLVLVAMKTQRAMDHPEVVHDEDPTQATTQRNMTQSRMQAALVRENPRVLRKSFLKLYGCIFVGYLCSATNGFDSTTFGMPEVLHF